MKTPIRITLEEPSGETIDAIKIVIDQWTTPQAISAAIATLFYRHQENNPNLARLYAQLINPDNKPAPF